MLDPYRSTEVSSEEMQSLLDSGIFVIDASALLNLYKLGPTMLVSFIDTLRNHKDRFWLTHQTLMEYQTSRKKALENAIEPLKKERDELVALLRGPQF